LPDPNSEMGVSPDKVVERLCREPLGMALWRAAVAEEMVEVYRDRIDQLTAQKSPATRESSN
jgi:hypothetical protein